MARQDNKILALLGWVVTGDMGPYTFYTDQRGDIVFFPRMPALNPASIRQTVQRNKYREAAQTWRVLPATERANWELATKRLSLQLMGYNLWVFVMTTGRIDLIQTIERQSGITLL